MEKAKEIFDSLYAQALPLGIKIKYIAIDIWIGLKYFGIAALIKFFGDMRVKNTNSHEPKLILDQLVNMKFAEIQERTICINWWSKW